MFMSMHSAMRSLRKCLSKGNDNSNCLCWSVLPSRIHKARKQRASKAVTIHVPPYRATQAEAPLT